MKVAENCFCGSVAATLRVGVLESVAGGPALIAKMGLGNEPALSYSLRALRFFLT